MKYRYILALAVLFIGCKDAKEEALRQSVKSEITAQNTKQKTLGNTLEINKDIEIKINEKYVDDLKKIVDNGFENQLAYFEEEELGFLATYGNMFSYIFSSRQSWEDKLRLKTDKYFSPISTEKEVNNLYADYQKDIKNLRNQFLVNNPTIGMHQKFQNLEIPSKDITLKALDNHSRNNVALEIAEWVLEWLFGLFIVWLVVTILGVPLSGGVVSLISTIIFLVISVFASIYNDNQLLDKIREQNATKVHIDYTAIQNQLDTNTIKFYDENSKNITP